MSRSTIRIRNDFPEIARAARQIAEMLSAHGLDTGFVRTVNLGLEEVVTNIIKYGFDDEREHWIEVTLNTSATDLEIIVVDEGRPFDPLQHPEPDTTRPLDDREPGGLGISFFRQLFDELRYRREAGRNCLMMRKRMPDSMT
jgi:anti-sigma regulatory factor (Ser/Thr protein kinase)